MYCTVQTDKQREEEQVDGLLFSYLVHDHHTRRDETRRDESDRGQDDYYDADDIGLDKLS